ncbi:DUF3325 family protein [Sphingomonas trueperi]|uniref:DUF3325 family protein n=1 Tax=Sphingomonas trueperi TaxID=53317 RepID=UPI000EB554B7
MSLFALLLSVGGFTLLALATQEHHQRFLSGRATPARQRRLRAAAWTALSAALPLACLSGGAVFGPVLWSGSVMLAAALVFLAVNFWPQPTSSAPKARE